MLRVMMKISMTPEENALQYFFQIRQILFVLFIVCEDIFEEHVLRLHIYYLKASFGYNSKL